MVDGGHREELGYHRDAQAVVKQTSRATPAGALTRQLIYLMMQIERFLLKPSFPNGAFATQHQPSNPTNTPIFVNAYNSDCVAPVAPLVAFRKRHNLAHVAYASPGQNQVLVRVV